MGLAQCQTLLAKLMTDATLRKQFFDDSVSVGLEFGLGPEEATQFARLSAPQAERFASSLRNKRLGEVEKLLPLSRLVLKNPAFSERFYRDAARFGAAGVKKHRDDAVAFARLAEQAVRAGDVGPAWVADVLRYEAARLVAADPRRRWTVRLLRHSISDLVLCARSMREAPPPTKWTIAVWFRASSKGRLRHFHFSSRGPPIEAKFLASSVDKTCTRR